MITTIGTQLRDKAECKPVARFSGLLERKLNAHPVNSYDRSSIEDYIQRKFKESYAAEIHHFLPMILSLKQDKDFSAAVGLQKAEFGQLFLEQYLRESIDVQVSRLFDPKVFRDDIIEIGNLVSTHGGSSQYIFLLLTEILHRINRDWVVFTATDKVEQLLRKTGFSPTSLIEARVEKLTTSNTKWGIYYAAHPQVMCLYVPSVVSIIRKSRISTKILDLFEDDLQRISDHWRTSHV